MRLLMKNSATLSEEQLCHGHVVGAGKHVGPTDLRVGGPIAVQKAQFLRATAGKSYARGNLTCTVSFSITRDCSTYEAAERFCFQHPRDVLREDTLLILAEGTRQETVKLTLSDAALESCDCRQLGVAVIVSYVISGGALT